jgi:hypothetical protein
MTVSRRNVLLLGGLGAVGAGVLSLPRGEVEAKSISRLSSGGDAQTVPVGFRETSGAGAGSDGGGPA